MTAKGGAGGVGLANSCKSASYWQHAGNKSVWHDVYADQGVSELLRTHSKGHDLVQVAAVTQQAGMRRGDSNDEMLLERADVWND